MTCAVVPGQGKDGMKGKRIGCMALLARRKNKSKPVACFRRCVDRLLLRGHIDWFLHLGWQIFVIRDNCNIELGWTCATQGGYQL